MKKKYSFLVIIFLSFFILNIPVKANENETTVVGEASGHMSVVGDLRPQTSEPEIIEEKPELETPISEPETISNSKPDLPNTGEKRNNSYFVLIGLSLLGIVWLSRRKLLKTK